MACARNAGTLDCKAIGGYIKHYVDNLKAGEASDEGCNRNESTYFKWADADGDGIVDEKDLEASLGSVD